MLSKEEWNATAERAAAADYGQRHARWLRFRRFGAGPLGILMAIGAAAFASWWLFSHLIAPIFSGRGPRLGGHLSGGFLTVCLIALLLTVVAFRVRYLTTPLLIARALIAVFLWLGLTAFAVASLA